MNEKAKNKTLPLSQNKQSNMGYITKKTNKTHISIKY